MHYGWRAKIGLIIPSTGSASECEFHRHSPEGVAVFTTRVLFERVDPPGLEALGARAEEAAKLLATAGLDRILFGCTTGSLIKGIGYDQELSARLKKASGVEAVTTSSAVLAALRAFGAKRVAVATPYSAEVDAIERRFLEDNGIGVTAIRGLGFTDPCAMPKVTPNQMYQLARQVDSPDADALFISCTGLGLADHIPLFERDFGKPVVTSNQATWWAALRSLAIRDILPLGQLFAMDNVEGAPAAT